ATFTGSVQKAPWAVVHARCSRCVALAFRTRVFGAHGSISWHVCDRSTSRSSTPERTAACISNPRARRARTVARPTNPLAPVTRTRPTSLPLAHDRGAWHRDDEPAAAAAVLALLLEHFVGEVPDEQQHLVWLFLEQTLRRSDRHMDPWHVTALLVRAA